MLLCAAGLFDDEMTWREVSEDRTAKLTPNKKLLSDIKQVYLPKSLNRKMPLRGVKSEKVSEKRVKGKLRTEGGTGVGVPSC